MEKWAKNMNKQLTKEKVYIFNKYTRGCLNLLKIRKFILKYRISPIILTDLM